LKFILNEIDSCITLTPSGLNVLLNLNNKSDQLELPFSFTISKYTPTMMLLYLLSLEYITQDCNVILVQITNYWRWFNQHVILFLSF